MKNLIVPKIILFNTKRKKNRVLLNFSEKTQKVNWNKATKFKKRHPVIGLRVIYGKAKNVFGEMVIFKNEMKCKTYEDLKWGLQAFLDKDLWIRK